METIDCKEIYYASTEHSIITGYAGFGVRTYTEGMQVDEVTEIVEKCAPGYSVETDRMLTFEQISQNPRTVYDYAPAYAFRRVDLTSGGTRYVLSRTVYIGIDYGYFCKRDGAMRTGANYFAHLLVFDRLPSCKLFANIGNDGMFVPRDYTCSPDNKELQSLLTGEPQLLPTRRLQGNDNAIPITVDFARCITAMLQAYCNSKRSTDPALCKIIIKAPESTTPVLVRSLSELPDELVTGKRFTTNYMQGYGVPDEYDMVFVNEHNERELYEDSHVCVNLFDGTSRNIDDNYIYSKIIELTAAGEDATLKKLVAYYLKSNPAKEHDYNFEYNMFLATESSKNISLDDLSGEFIGKICNAGLDAKQTTLLWEKINAAVNNGLTSSRGLEINKAIAAAGYILQQCGQHLQLTPESRKWITDTIVFGDPSYLDKVTTAGSIDVLLHILDRNLITSEERFFASLSLSHDITVWKKLLHFYFDPALDSNITSIIGHIMQWGVPDEVKIDLIKELFPVERCGNLLYDYILEHTGETGVLIDIVRRLCLNSREERFSAILKHSNNDPAVITVLSPLVAEYYINMVTRDPGSGIKALLAFIDAVSAPVFNSMSASRIIDSYADACMKNPAGCERELLERLTAANISISHEAAEKIATATSLIDGTVPPVVDCNILLTANRMGKDAGYIKLLYEAWLKLSPSKKEVAAYASQATGMTPQVIGEIILSTWQSPMRTIRDDREAYVLAIADNAKWRNDDRKAFIKSCQDKTLAKYLSDSDKFFTKLTRKLFKRS